MNHELTIRPATMADAELIAHAVCMAVDYDISHPIYPVFLTLARMEHTQYSYQNTLIAEVNGKGVGALVGYDGALLEELRKPIFPLLERYLGAATTIEDETEAGEFYLDSCGILPDYRGMGIGRALIATMRDKAFMEGHTRVGLIVDVDNPDAERLYLSLGFKRVGNKRFLGHDMHHLQAWR